MKNVLISGKNGQLSKAISEWLNDKQDVCAEQISLRGNAWENESFCDYDTVVHVAGIVPKDDVKTDDFYAINHKLTERFANKAKKDGVKHFIYFSSMSVYGVEPQMNTVKGTVNEKTSCKPTSDYGKSKLLAEESLRRLSDDSFKITIIRVPSVYGKGKTEYLDQYKNIVNKFSKLPKVFTDKYKSMIYLDNLCELIHLIIKFEKYGIICPDDGQVSAFDICKAIAPKKKISKLLGLALLLIKNNARVKDYFGAVCYSKDLTDEFNGEYRVCNYRDAIAKSYEK